MPWSMWNGGSESGKWTWWAKCVSEWVTTVGNGDSILLGTLWETTNISELSHWGGKAAEVFIQQLPSCIGWWLLGWGVTFWYIWPGPQKCQVHSTGKRTASGRGRQDAIWTVWRQPPRQAEGLRVGLWQHLLHMGTTQEMWMIETGLSQRQQGVVGIVPNWMALVQSKGIIDLGCTGRLY